MKIWYPDGSETKFCYNYANQTKTKTRIIGRLTKISAKISILSRPKQNLDQFCQTKMKSGPNFVRTENYDNP